MKKIGITIGALILLAAGGFGWWVFSRPTAARPER